MQTATKTKTVSLFGQDFEDLFSIASPFMSPFLKNMVVKLRKGAEHDDVTPHRQKELYEECLFNMAKGLEFSIAKISTDIGPNPEAHVRRLRRIVDRLIEEGARK